MKYNDSLKDVLVENDDNVSVVDYLEHINKDDAIGYISIPKIDVYLTIYEGTSQKKLETGIGHLEGTSMPVGGMGTHSALTGHTGLVKQKLFDDLDKLEIDDMFYIQVMDNKLAYKVDQIKVVEPDDDSDLKIDNDKDFVTLITCTPYGINSHRLLVRGSRVEYDVNQEDIKNTETVEDTENNFTNISENDTVILKDRYEKYGRYLILLRIFAIVLLFLVFLGFYSAIKIRKKINKSKR